MAKIIKVGGVCYPLDSAKTIKEGAYEGGTRLSYVNSSVEEISTPYSEVLEFLKSTDTFKDFDEPEQPAQ